MSLSPRPLLHLLMFLALTTSPDPGLAAATSRVEMAVDGLLIITAAQDSTRSFHWEEGPGSTQLSLVWPEGRLIVPADLAMQEDADGNLGVPILAGFAGAGESGSVILQPGLQPISESLAFGDGRVQWLVSAGEMEISRDRVIYRRPWPAAGGNTGKGLKDQRANFLMIAGLLLLIAVLLRRARAMSRRKS